MKDKLKRFILLIAFVIISYFGISLLLFFAFHHHFVFNYKTHLGIFNDSVKKNINPFLYACAVKKGDLLSFYIYSGRYYIDVWEFKDIDETIFDRIKINQNIDLDNIKFYSGEELTENAYPKPFIKLKLHYNLNNGLSIDLDDHSKILKIIDSVNYKGFYGKISRMAFSTKGGDHFVLFDYYGISEPTLFLINKKGSSLFFIIINSKVKFDESIINIFKLE